MNRSNDESDAGAPLPDFSASRAIQLQTIAPALGIQAAKPDYLDYDPKGRGIFTTMCANAGVAYLIGTSAGGVYGFRQGLAATPSSRLRVQVNSILNHCGRYGSRAGNAMGIYAIFYSLFEGMADKYEVDEQFGFGRISPTLATFTAPALGATLASATYYIPNGPRVAGLAGTIGLGAVTATYVVYSIMGIPYGSRGFLFF